MTTSQGEAYQTLGESIYVCIQHGYSLFCTQNSPLEVDEEGFVIRADVNQNDILCSNTDYQTRGCLLYCSNTSLGQTSFIFIMKTRLPATV